ncbi:MAG: hypothetical protein K0R18_171 [Bacillales bacterium]|jgi:hypothetical protein|nr:hypothetical protein [Bacillales bacterium]
MLVNDETFSKYEVLNIYLYGSKVYGCNPNGDDDYIVVVKGKDINEQFVSDEYDATFYSEDVFQHMIDEHDISVLECLFLPEDKIIKEDKKFKFELNLNKLRINVSAKTSNSFVKCKKKLAIGNEREAYIGKKSLFHSLRMPMFGIQIAKYGKIVDYSEANEFWNIIIQNEINDWTFYKKTFQPISNMIMTEFRKLAPLEEPSE